MRRLVIGAALAGVALSVVLAIVGVDWWALPTLGVAVALAVRILLLAERNGTTVATMKRNAERVRVLEKERHQELLSSVAARGVARSEVPMGEVRAPRVTTSRPQEPLEGPDSATFVAHLPPGTSAVHLWLEVGGFDILPAEYLVEVDGDGERLWNGEVGGYQAGAMLALGRFYSQGMSTVRVGAQWPPTLRTGLPPALAFVGLVSVADHPVLPGATARITRIEETDE